MQTQSISDMLMTSTWLILLWLFLCVCGCHMIYILYQNHKPNRSIYVRLTVSMNYES